MKKQEKLTRRAVIGTAGLAAAAALAGPPSELQAASAEAQSTIAESIQSMYQGMTREQIRDQQRALATQRYKLRILNNFTWPVRVVVCSFKPRVHHNVEVAGGGGTYSQSHPEMYGGHRVAIVWDPFTEQILDYQDIQLDHDMTFTIDAGGSLTCT